MSDQPGLPEGFDTSMFVTEGDAIIHETTQPSASFAVHITPEAFHVSDVLGDEYKSDYVRTWHAQTYNPVTGEETLTHLPYSEKLAGGLPATVMRVVSIYLEANGLPLPTMEEVVAELAGGMFGEGQTGSEPPF